METQQNNKRSFWKSLDEKYQTPEFIEQAEKEFQSSPLKEEDDKSGMARRQFMKLMGASIAMSTAACVRRPVQKIIPYNKRPSEVIIGIPNYYASCLHDGREVLGITVKTREGRPLFLDGNGDYPGNGGGLSVRGSSQILALYDPDRVRNPTINSQNKDKRGNMLSVPRDWDSLDKMAVEQMKAGGIHILTSQSSSPSLNAALTAFAQNTGAKVHSWTPINESEVLEAARLCYGKAAVPKYRYDKAKLIVSIDGDFLGTYLNPTGSSRLYSKGRKPDAQGRMSKLVSFQSVTSLTSLNADDNYPIKPSQQLPVVLGLIHELAFVQKKVAANGQVQSLTQSHSKVYETLGLSHDEFAAVATELFNNRGESIVVAGGLPTKTKDRLALQIAVNYLNSLLNNDGATIYWNHGLNGHGNSDKDLNELLSAMENGEVKTLIINDLNPLYFLPASAQFKEKLGKVGTVIVTNNWMDETAILADMVAPAGHDLENWGDHEFESGLGLLQQPTIRPLHNTRSFGDSLMVWSKGLGKALSDQADFYGYVKSRWMSKIGSEQAWFDLLQTGFFGKAFDGNEGSLSFNPSALYQIKVATSSEGLQLSLYEKVALRDGTMTNVAWLQELPDPVSKIVWDNYLMVAPAFADQNKLRDGQMVNLKVGDVSVKLPTFVCPGQHPESVAVAVGYGRSHGGDLQKAVGFNVQDLIQWDDSGMITAGLPVEITPTQERYDLANTQGHHTMMGRDLAVETTAKSFNESGDIGIHRHKIFSIWEGHKYEGHKWAMGIDLNSCTGCSACMIACQSENNIPTVGKKYVLGGREMHWIRIDRYFSGDEKKSVDAVFQPVTCQHCENAPCETVCPVLATVHSDEGLNDMVYNRCVGTRYCSNNCPYKVRRFNWFYYDGHHRKEPLHMALNPDVTVRTRGVMEKCTFCVQRIKAAKNVAKDEGRPLQDGDVKTACQTVCPTEAIVFGDLNDENSEVRRWFENPRHYTLLEEFNAAPRVRYLAKLRNTERDLGGGHHGAGHHGQDVQHDSEHKEGH